MSDDLIRRSDVIKAIDDNVNGSDNRVYLKDLIKAIPTIEPSEYADIAYGIGVCQGKASVEPKRGEWMPYKQHNGETVLWKCSECGHTIYSETKTDRLAYHKWCGRCGARMKGADDE